MYTVYMNSFEGEIFTAFMVLVLTTAKILLFISLQTYIRTSKGTP